MNSIKKGQLCSINGNNYEKQIYNIVKNCYLNDNKFNTQKIKDLGGSKNINDIQCNYLSNNDIGIEIKKFNTPDWMQCVIKYNNETNIWETSNKSKIPIQSKELFNKLLNDYLIFNGEIPPFINKKITHEEWSFCSINVFFVLYFLWKKAAFYFRFIELSKNCFL